MKHMKHMKHTKHMNLIFAGNPLTIPHNYAYSSQRVKPVFFSAFLRGNSM